MRNDLTKVLCEAERPRSWDHYSNYRNLKKFEDRQVFDEEDFDDRAEFGRYTTFGGSASRESMKFRYGWNQKDFGEHLSPLYGLIRKNVGKKWDKFYSELKKNFDTRSATGNHIFQHLFDQLAKPEQTYIGEDGKVWFLGGYWGSNKPIGETYFEYYVDPRDGILKINRHKRTYRQQREHDAKMARQEAEKTRRTVDRDTELHLINGVWFEVKFITFAGTRTTKKETNKYSKSVYYRESIEYPFTYDVLQKRTVQANRVAVSKRTISHKELKKYGLVV